MEIDRSRKARGALLGAALGDAFGAPFEGEHSPSEPEIEAAFAAGPPVFWMDDTLSWTDDTAMTIAFAESLVAVGGLDEDHLAQTFARHWAADPRRGYGRGLASCSRPSPKVAPGKSSHQPSLVVALGATALRCGWLRRPSPALEIPSAQ